MNKMKLVRQICAANGNASRIYSNKHANMAHMTSVYLKQTEQYFCREWIWMMRYTAFGTEEYRINTATSTRHNGSHMHIKWMTVVFGAVYVYLNPVL